MKKLCAYLMLASAVVIPSVSMGGGIPIWGRGEVITQMVDTTQSNAVSDLVQTQYNLMESALKGLKGSYGASSVKENMKKTLTACSKAITGKYEGLANILGKNSSYGQIKVKKCGGNIPSVVSRVQEALADPPSEQDRAKMTTAERAKRDNNRNNAIENAATTTLSKAWTIETEAAGVAAAISNTQDELDNAKSQMNVIVTILRLQEETQKNINTRLSLMGDELISSGLMALDSGL